MSTRAIRYLLQNKIAFEVIEYDHLKKGAEFAAQATGFPLARTVKTLVLAAAPGRYALALLPGDRQADMKRLAGALSVKRVEMADTASAERLSGYRVGGVSPFGFRQRLPVLMEEGLLSHESILVNGGRRGTMLKMDPAAIRDALGCRVARIAEAES
ncbi:MAG: aminoacyl-tRNA deacylase [Desulfobacterales bacterium]